MGIKKNYFESDEYRELQKSFLKFEEESKQREEDVWDSLDEDTQLDVFCYVIRNLCKGELEDNKSYRGVLYDTFGFSMESYARAQFAGFLELHNSIRNSEEIYHILEEFVKKNGINISKDKIDTYITENHL